jgi:hypothetical protein
MSGRLACLGGRSTVAGRSQTLDRWRDRERGQWDLVAIGSEPEIPLQRAFGYFPTEPLWTYHSAPTCRVDLEGEWIWRGSASRS